MTALLWRRPRFIFAFSLFLFCLFGTFFAKITDEVWLENEFLPLDQVMNRLMATNHLQEPHDWLFFLGITRLAEGSVLAVLLFMAVASLWFYRRKVEAALLLAGFSITGLSVVLFKLLTDRVRPAGAALLNETSGAFPSGHAALSLFFFGFLGYLLSRQTKKKLYSSLVFAAGLSIAGLIGISRVYLNVHWVSDVLAGFALAAAFLSLCIGFMEIRKLRAL
jgi:membrane-associated phospholipid phosphatase